MTVNTLFSFRRLFASFFLIGAATPTYADEPVRRFLSGAVPTEAICDVVTRVESAEGGGRVVGAEGGGGVTPAEGGGDVVPAEGGFASVDAQGRPVAPAGFNPNLDVTPRRVSFDLAFDPRLLGGTAVVNQSVGRVDYDIESGVFRLDGRVIGVARDDAFRRWCESLQVDQSEPSDTPGVDAEGDSDSPTNDLR